MEIIDLLWEIVRSILKGIGIALFVLIQIIMMII